MRLSDMIDVHSRSSLFKEEHCIANDLSPPWGYVDPPKFFTMSKNASSSMKFAEMIAKHLCMPQLKKGGSRSHEAASRCYFVFVL